MTTIESRRQFTDSSPGTAEATQQSAPPSTRPEDERLGLGRTFGYGVQHILAMFGGVIRHYPSSWAAPRCRHRRPRYSSHADSSSAA